jgi:heme A synthase
MNLNPNNPGSPRWLHALAVLTVLCTLPLLILGAGVTSHGVGMVDPRGFRPPWEIVNGLFENSGLGWRLEYGHRTFGFLVGLCGIGLAAGCWFGSLRTWLAWVGLLALGLICAQGALGIFRVDYNALHGRTFALIHGVFAQIVFAVLVSVALLTSRRWASDPAEEASPALKRWSIVTALLVLGQLLFGGMVRHHDSLLGPRGHLLGAFVVVAAVVWLLKLIRDSQARARFAVARILFMALLGLQLLLGMESWLAKYYIADVRHEPLLPVPMHAEWIRTAHYVVGSLIFATSVSVALLAQRRPALAMEEAPARSHELEGAL